MMYHVKTIATYVVMVHDAAGLNTIHSSTKNKLSIDIRENSRMDSFVAAIVWI